MNRLTNRRRAGAAAVTACGLILTGCGAGQISQTASQEPAVNGSAATVKDIALRNVQLQAVQKGDFLQPGATVPLVFVAANNSPDTPDKLVAVSSDIGQVTLTGDGTVPARGALIVEAPAAPGDAAPAGDATGTTAQVALSKPITNGLTYNVTFDFEKAGRAVVAVPLSAGEAPRRP